MVKYNVDITATVIETLEVTQEHLDEYREYLEDYDMSEDDLLQEYIQDYIKGMEPYCNSFCDVNYEVFEQPAT